MPSWPPLVVVTGASGAGKSTLCQAVVAEARDRGIAVFGVTTVARPAAGRHAALGVRNISTGEEMPLAEWDAPASGPSTGRWHFHQRAFDEGVAWCAGVPPGAVFLVDELGPIELLQGLGWSALIPRLRAHDGPVLVVVRPALVDTFVALMGDRPATLVTVTAAARAAGSRAVALAFGWVP